MSEQNLELCVLTLTGNTHIVPATPSWSVHGVKDEIATTTKIAQHQQRLLFGARVLSDTEILREFLPASAPNSTHGKHELLLVICEDEGKGELITSVALGQKRLTQLDRKYREDTDIVRAAVHFDGLQLQLATGVARKDRGICLAAVKQNGFALSYAPSDFCSDRDIVLMAVKSNAFSITLADRSLQSDCSFAIAAVSQNPFVRDHLEKAVLEKEQFVTAFTTTAAKTTVKSHAHEWVQHAEPQRVKLTEKLNGAETAKSDCCRRRFPWLSCMRLSGRRSTKSTESSDQRLLNCSQKRRDAIL